MRIAPIPPGTRADLAPQEAQLMAERGRVSLLYQVLFNSPQMAHGWEQLLSAIRNRNSLDAGIRELIILRVATLNNAPYEFDAHVPYALKAGLEQTAIDAVPDFTPGCPLFNMEQSLALQLADTMTRNIDVPDALYARVAGHWSTQQQVDLMVTIAAYNMVSRFLVATKMTYPPSADQN